MRKELLANGNYYHVINRSISQYQIFKEEKNCDRFNQILDLYRYINLKCRFSEFLELSTVNQQNIIDNLKLKDEKLVEIIAYCLMPTHFHLILRQLTEKGISSYMSKVLNSFSRYFNLHYNRKGPLWESRFKSILVNSEEQLLHLTRYIHLNPVSTNLVQSPDDWRFSSYNVYVNKSNNGLCKTSGLVDLSKNQYRKFVNDRISYQKELSKIKRLLLENYSG